LIENNYALAALVLEDGTVFNGVSIGVAGQTIGEVVFNTSMTGYQEILTDPSYKKQIVTLTYPHIGNTGVNEEDEESSCLHLSGLVIKNLPLMVSNWRCNEDLSRYLTRHHIVAIANIDIRKLTRLLTQKGALKGCIISRKNTKEPVFSADEIKQVLSELDSFSGLKGLDLAQQVSTSRPYVWTEGSWNFGEGFNKSNQQTFHVVAYDFGVKRNILRLLADRDCKVTVVPAKTKAEDVLALNPDGVFLSNGPGDPEPCDYAITAIKTIVETGLPVFGICLGHQLLALASGAKTLKMKFGHHGANHPVLDIQNQEVAITSQNHGFAVDETQLPSNLTMTHKSLFDQSLQGIHRTDKPAFGFQGHPEASPGPHDILPLFDHFIDLIKAK